MDLKEAKAFRDKKVKEGNKSDGCTAALDLGIKEWCVMHDMLRRFKPVTAFQADNLFFKGICTEGKRYWLIACIYWLGVRIPNLLGIIE